MSLQFMTESFKTIVGLAFGDFEVEVEVEVGAHFRRDHIRAP
jgi:hypothetical protein